MNIDTQNLKIPSIQPTYGTEDAIHFLAGTGKDAKGRTIKDYIQFDNATWEQCHDHIQWAFPSSVKSAFNPTAPVIDFEEFARILEDLRTSQDEFHRVTHKNIAHNVALLLTAYMNSIGVLDIYKGRSPDPTQLMWLLDSSDHNHRRITRVFMFMHHMLPVMGVTSIGWTGTTHNLFITIVQEFCKSRAFNADTLHFWNKAHYCGSN